MKKASVSSLVSSLKTGLTLANVTATGRNKSLMGVARRGAVKNRYG